jgi:hypothetical protein
LLSQRHLKLLLLLLALLLALVLQHLPALDLDPLHPLLPPPLLLLLLQGTAPQLHCQRCLLLPAALAAAGCQELQLLGHQLSLLHRHNSHAHKGSRQTHDQGTAQ